MHKITALVIAASVGWTGAAFAQTCSPVPNTLTNGTTADADKVMGNFNSIMSCVNNNLAPKASPTFTGNVAVSGQIMSVGYGQDLHTQDANLLFGNSNYYQQLFFLHNDQKFHLSAGLDISGNSATVGGLQFTDMAGTHPNMLVQGDNNFVFYNTDAQGNPSTTFYQFARTNSSPFVFSAPVGYASDRRLKKNIQPLAGGLAAIQKLRPVRFDWMAPAERTVGKQLTSLSAAGQIGFVAQEVQQAIPEAVMAPRDSNDIYTYRPDVVIAVLVKAVQEQQAQIDTLKAQVAALKPATQ